MITAELPWFMVKCLSPSVLPQLKYALTVWEPVTKFNMAKVESVQRRATVFFCNDYHQTSSVTSVMQELDWEDLQSRQNQKKL